MPNERSPSPVQLDVLTHVAACPSQSIQRLIGGFWTTPSTPVRTNAFGYEVPDWSVTVHTIQAMEKRGWLKRTRRFAESWCDDRILTQDGLKMLQISRPQRERAS